MPLTGSFWPTRTQKLLLRSALARPDLQLAAWQQLGPGFNLRTLEPGSISVLPLIYRNLSRSLPEDPRLPHLKGVYRSTWVKNNLLAEQLATAMDVFDGLGVETLLLGSLGAATRYFPEFGLRPSPALELVVERTQLLSAWRGLGGLGWAADTALVPDGDQSITLVNAHGQVCLLRTVAAEELSLDYRALLPASVSVEVGKTTVRAPAPEHDLLAACAAGGRIKEVASVQWLVDVARIAQTATPEFDWEGLRALARDQGQTLRLAQTVAYLADELSIPLPPPASRLRDASAVPFRERLAYRCAGVSGLGSLPQAVAEHLVATRARSGLQALFAFPEFMRRRWELAHRWQLPLAGSRRIYKRVTSRHGRPI